MQWYIAVTQYISNMAGVTTTNRMKRLSSHVLTVHKKKRGIFFRGKLLVGQTINTGAELHYVQLVEKFWELTGGVKCATNF